MNNRILSVCALIPAYNESERISITISALKARKEIHSIVVCDDGSTDNTVELAKSSGADLVLTQKNMGKGAALTNAYESVRGKYDVYLLLDADLGASAGEAVKLLPPLWKEEADMVIGMLPPDPEFAETGESGGTGMVVSLANWGIKRSTGKTFQQPLNGQRAIRKEVLEKIGGKFQSGFGVEVALTITTLKAGFRVVEVDTQFRHKVTGSDWSSVFHRGHQFIDVAKALLGNRS